VFSGCAAPESSEAWAVPTPASTSSGRGSGRNPHRLRHWLLLAADPVHGGRPEPHGLRAKGRQGSCAPVLRSAADALNASHLVERARVVDASFSSSRLRRAVNRPVLEQGGGRWRSCRSQGLRYGGMQGLGHLRAVENGILRRCGIGRSHELNLLRFSSGRPCMEGPGFRWQIGQAQAGDPAGGALEGQADQPIGADADGLRRSGRR